MKLIRLARCGLSATLAAGGLLIFAPAASAIPNPACDVEDDPPVLQLVEGWVMPTGGPDGLDCTDRPSRNQDDSGDDGSDSRISNENEVEQDEAPTDTASPDDEVADESGDPLAPNPQPPVSESNTTQAQESDNAQRDTLVDDIVGVLGLDDPRSLASAGGGSTTTGPESFFTELQNEFVNLLSAF
ncbi:MAG: hypothetical protein ACRDZO_07025 [Egibacteraceae bacterium]